MTTVSCDRCGEQFNTYYDEVRLRNGDFSEPGGEESYDQLCEDCHRDIVK